MSNELHNKAIQAAERFCERRGYEILATSWQPADGEGAIDLVAQDDETMVFIEVNARPCSDEGFDEGRMSRSELEVLAAKWLGENSPEGDVSVRFDQISMLVVSTDRALLRHHINAFSEA